MQLEKTPEFNDAVELLCNSNKHLFITGSAGTGKSTLLEYCRQHSSKNLVVVAPTGVAALNVQGQTIHRFFGFPINVTPEKIKNSEIQPRTKRIYKELQTLIIDEVSMLRADILDCIDVFLRLYGPAKEEAFGGVQLVLVGDLYQLPPVISSAEQSFFSSRYDSAYFFSAEVFRNISFHIIELTKIYRQKDADFINLLGRIRHNMATKKDIELLNSRSNASLPQNEFYINLTTTNLLADEINSQALEQLESPAYISEANIEGNFQKDSFPTSETLKLKVGAQIMFLNNDSKKRWVNGSLGKIEEIKINTDRIRYLRIRLQNNKQLVDVFPYTWEIYKYSLCDKEIISDVIGCFTQFPIRLAWAVTIHKSQGKTFDYINLNVGNGTFATGQLYVALSRCTSFDGLRLEKSISANHISTDPKIVSFMNSVNKPPMPLIQKTQFLKQAILNHQKLEISYRKTNGELSKRIIIPIRIKNENVLSFCIQRQEQRSFNINRIEKLKTFVE